MAEQEEELYCLCRRPYDEEEFMIECDICHDWFHGSCVGIEEHQAPDIDSYHCPNCQPEHGPLTLKRRRNWHRHDYSEINDGGRAIQSGTVMFINKLKKKKFINAESEILRLLKGSEVTPSYFDLHGFTHPIIVKDKDGLRVKLPPPSFKISDVERCVGSMRELDVIDVARQDDIKMTMREWTEYYEVVKPRKKILNVISLEFSGTELSKFVSPPLTVRKIDWINCHWPDDLPEDSPLTRPCVQKYCLMSVKDSYTDFHVDFGGTSVWYHVLWGEKVFYLIPPTDENLIRYEQWVLSSNQSEVFFGDQVPKCYICRVRKGNTLFIPSGWIHAVLTPEDSLVFGGNFVHSYAIPMQLRIYEMEFRLDTPLKFRHPCYEGLTWFAAKNILSELNGHLNKCSVPPDFLLDGLREIRYSLNSWIRTKERLKVHGSQIPPSIRPMALVDKISETITALEEIRDQQAANERSLKGQGSLKRSQSDSRHSPIRMKLTTGRSEIIDHEQDGVKQISMKLTVPQVKMVSSSKRENQPYNDPYESSDDEGQRSQHHEASEMGRKRAARKGAGLNRWRVEDVGEDYEDEDYVYPDPMDGEDEVDHVIDTEEDKGRVRKKRDDDLWKPGGSVKLLKNSAANSSREKRNAIKRSFEHTLSPAASKILKMEEQKQGAPSQEQRFPSSLYAGGGSLNSKEPAVGKSRATAAADAVNAMVAASRPKTKLHTAKQRLGKIMGLKGGGSRWKT